MSRGNIITGLRAVEQLLASPGTHVKKLYVEYRTANPRVTAVAETARARGIEIQSANRARLAQISGDNRHQGVVAEVQRTSRLDEGGLRTLVEDRLRDEVAPPLLLLILDTVQDPHNLGACMRSADATGVDALIVPRHSSADLGSTVSKVAAGAAEHLPYARVNNLAKVLDWLREYGVRVVGTSDNAEAVIYEADFSAPTALVMGGEHAGLRAAIRTRCDALVHLPMAGEVASLNVSVATGVCLYEVVRQRRGAD